jgi:hypothetical protein
VVLIRATHVSSVLSIVAAAADSVVPLVLGLPARDEMVGGESTRSFSFTPSFGGAYTVALTPYTRGDPNLVVTRPDGGESWTSALAGADWVIITPRFEDLNLPYKIEVTMADDTAPSDAAVSFSVTANVNGGVTSPGVLLGGFPQYDYLDKGTEKYYTLAVPRGSADVVIIVDSLYGDADLFVNPSSGGFYQKPIDADAAVDEVLPRAMWSSEHSFGSETVFIGSEDTGLIRNGGQYFITVVGFEVASINIRAYSAETAIAVIEGQPARGEMSDHSFHYYKFYDNHPSETLVVNVNPVFGDPDIYIGCQLAITGNSSGYPSNKYHHYNVSSAHIGEDSIFISPNDRYRCSQGVYYMVVYGYSKSEFIITIIHEGGAVLLADGVPVQDSVFANMGRNYNFRVGPEAEELSVRLTSFAGDADLFVKMGGEASLTNFDFRSSSLASIDDVDSVTIPEGRICVDCFISIFVHGYQTAKYALVAIMEDTTIQLVDSVPFMESVAYNKIQYYTLAPISAGNVSVIVTVFSGTPVLYVSNSEEKPGPNTSNTLVDSGATRGDVPLLVTQVSFSSDGNGGGSLSPKPIFIGVGGGGSNCSYTVRAALRPLDTSTGHTRPALLRLIQGTPQRESIKYGDGTSQWRYYQVSANAGHQSIDVRATGLIGNIDLYVMRCPYSNFQCAGNFTAHDNGVQQSYLPSMTDHDQTTQGQANDWLTIMRDDLSPCSYIVGVYSLSMFVEYQISFTTENSILMLQPGVAVNDAVDAKEYSYFSFAMPPGRLALRIILTPLSGDPDLFVSAKTMRPLMDNFTWRSSAYGADTLTIAPISQPSVACTDCIYYIGVYGYQASSFSIIATLANVMIRLTEGHGISDRVESKTWNYYAFSNYYRDTHDLKVIVTPSSGDSAVYITLDSTEPTELNYAFTTGSLGDGQDVIEIRSDDPSYAPCLVGDCMIVVGVYGYTDSEFNILVASSMTSTQLSFGLPQLGSLRYGLYDHYRFPATGMADDTHDGVRLTLSQYSGTVRAYIACNMEFPNATKHHVVFNPSDIGGNSMDLTLGAFPAGCSAKSQMSIAVWGISSATYSISVVHTHGGAAATDQNSLMLLPGLSVSDSVTFKKFTYYYIRVGSSSGDLNIVATVSTGDVDLYVSGSWEERPVLNKKGEVISYSVKSSAVGAEDLTIPHSEMAVLCAHKMYCYLVVGVLGVFYDGVDAHSVSQYRLMQTIGTTSITLSSGVSQRGHVDARFSQYYMYTMTDMTYDVVISATTFYGDPDLYVSTWPNAFPSGSNYTWMTAYWGDDTITIQASSLAGHCGASIAHNGNCELYIGVTAYTNTSYSVLAYMDEGFSRPTALIDGQAQSGTVQKGDYVYFSFPISLATNALATGLTFTMTPTSEGDADMFLVLRPDGGEPGRDNADYSTSKGPGQVDEIRVTPNMPYYCLHCVAQIAVFGFSTGSFSIVATTDNMIGLVNGLSVGGSVEAEGWRYYSIYNADPMADVSITLSAESGDPDLYVTAYKPPIGGQGAGAAFTLPTQRSFTWHSLHTGDDDITISDDMDLFCFECYYVVGVFANTANATYHIQATTKESPVTSLYKNRPQMAVAHGISVKHFRVTESTSTEDVTISVTSMGSGSISMYFQAYNASTYKGEVPDPAVRSSYSQTSSNPNLYFDVDHDRYRRGFDDELIYVVSVKTFTDIRYSIMATSTLSVVTLYQGQPQNQVVDKGFTALFRYYIAKPTDLQISLMAREGDPDLVVSMTHEKPGCIVNSYGNVLCSNFTWRSSSTSTDQIVISRDSPCAVVVGGTIVGADCKPSSFTAPGYVYIGVFGYEFSKFTLLVSPLGGRITLLAGVPQLAVTSPSYVCERRFADSGSCDKTKQMEEAQTAYFSFRLNPSEGKARTDDESTVIISVLPFCDDGDAYAQTGVCQAGCPCSPLQVYVRSCILSECVEADYFPSPYPGQYADADTSVDAFIGSSVAVRPSQGQLGCDPSAAGEPCVINVVVMSPLGVSGADADDRDSARFSITARSAGDVTLLPCADLSHTPDGNRDLQEQVVRGSHYFEICNSGGPKEITTVTVESCYKSPAMYACTSSDAACDHLLPSWDSWGAYSTKDETCTFDPIKNHGNINCDPTETGSPVLQLMDSGNYYLLANGTSDFVLHVKQTMKSGSEVSPALYQSGSRDHVISPSISKKGEKAVTLSFLQSAVLFPLAPGSTPFWSSYIRYTVHAVEKKLIDKVDKNVVHTTPCGLKHTAVTYPSYSRLHTVPSVSLSSVNRKEKLTYSVSGLKPGTKYAFMVTAICDGNCLREIQKTTPNAGDICTGVASCQPQTLVYPQTVYTTEGTAGDEGSSWSSSAMKFISIVGIILVSLVGLATLGLGGWYFYDKQMGSGGQFRSGPSSSANPFSDMRDAASAAADPLKKVAQSAQHWLGSGSNSSSSSSSSSTLPRPVPHSAATSSSRPNSSGEDSPGVAMKTRAAYVPPSMGGGKAAAAKSQYARLMSEEHDEELDNAGL